MNNPSKEDLLGYVLGALDADQQQQVQQSIDQDPQIEDDLLEIKTSLAPLELLENGSGSRPGLARRTCESLAILQKTELAELADALVPIAMALTPVDCADGPIATAPVALVNDSEPNDTELAPEAAELKPNAID